MSGSGWTAARSFTRLGPPKWLRPSRHWIEPSIDLPPGLPAEVEHRYTMDSTDGPLESARIRCPLGHWFSGPVESLRCERPGPEAGTGELRAAARTAARGGH